MIIIILIESFVLSTGYHYNIIDFIRIFSRRNPGQTSFCHDKTRCILRKIISCSIDSLEGT